jgi:hypothetical protein
MRKKPFDGIDAYEVLRLVREGKRPPIPESDAAGLQADLIQRCWAQDPSVRPSFQQILEYLKPLIDDDINVMQLRSHSEVYLNDDNEEHAAIKFLRKSRQGFYHQLPSSVMYCRVWSTMFNAGELEKGVAWFRSRFYSMAAENATSCFCLVNDYGKAKLYLGYGTQEQLKLTDSFVGASALPQVTSMFAELKPMLCTPLIRENLELVQFNVRADRKPKVAQLLYATLAHVSSLGTEPHRSLLTASFRTNLARMKRSRRWCRRHLLSGQTGTRAKCPYALSRCSHRPSHSLGSALSSCPIIRPARFRSCLSFPLSRSSSNSSAAGRFRS